MKSTIKYIASFIILVSLLCSYQSNTTSTMESDINEYDTTDVVGDMSKDTVSVSEIPDSLFVDCSSYLNAYAVEDMEELREYV